MLDFRMETFLTVCKYMNFTHAAEALGAYSACCFSAHSISGKKKYEAPLFIRDKKKLSLTPAGRMLHSALVTMRNDENTLKNDRVGGERLTPVLSHHRAYGSRTRRFQ